MRQIRNISSWVCRHLRNFLRARMQANRITLRVKTVYNVRSLAFQRPLLGNLKGRSGHPERSVMPPANAAIGREQSAAAATAAR